MDAGATLSDLYPSINTDEKFEGNNSMVEQVLVDGKMTHLHISFTGHLHISFTGQRQLELKISSVIS